MTVQNNV